jgi:hypothetical protein
MIINLVKKRSDDKSILKYFLPFGYMRRYLARTYGFAVEDGDFKKRPITRSDIKGFRFKDLLPLFVVMRLQEKNGGFSREKVDGLSTQRKIEGLERKVSALHRDLKLLTSEFSEFQKKMLCEIERLSVENMRLLLAQREEDKGSNKVI